MTGSLRIKHKTYYMVFSWKDELGQWRQKSESTGIPERGGKRKAQELLNNRLAELQAQSTAALTVKDVPFLDFLKNWLEDRMTSELRPNTFTQYRQVVENSICQYKPFVGVKLKKLTPPLIQSYINERVKGGLSPNSIRKHYCIIHKCLDYAMKLDMLFALFVPPNRQAVKNVAKINENRPKSSDFRRFCGGDNRTRICDLPRVRRTLYRLSYASI